MWSQGFPCVCMSARIVIIVLCSAGARGFKIALNGRHLEDIYEYSEIQSKAF